MRKMGIDYGSKNVGIALSDEGGSMAFPHGVIPNSPKLVDVVLGLITEKKVGEIIIGHSLDRDGKPNNIHAGAEALMLDITLATGLPVHFQSEQYSTQAALRLQGRTDQTDASAAAIILDSYITKRK